MDYPPNAGRPLAGYEDFHAALMMASYHNASDRTGEMGAAHAAEEKAASIAVQHGWAFWQIKQAHEAAKPLVEFDSLMQKVMNQLRK
jgi:hypothetical protein